MEVFPKNQTDLTNDFENEMDSDESLLVPRPNSVPLVVSKEIGNSTGRDQSSNISMQQCLGEIQKCLQYIQKEFVDYQHYKSDKDDCITIFEREVEELSKNWDALK